MNVQSRTNAAGKLPWPDLATVPLGTDEEAAGARAMHKEIAEARWIGRIDAPGLSSACWFYVVVVVVIGASFVSALWI